jgi:hypothetical protein
MKFARKSHINLVCEHYEKVWGIEGRDVGFVGGPLDELPDGFKILEFEPHGDRPMWTYATCGMSSSKDISPMELHMFSPHRSGEPVELLVATAHYHRTGSTLAVGHTVNFGKPWIETSPCEFGLISLPYLDGPKLENLKLGGGIIVRCLWLIPITASEVDFKKQNGLDALEDCFDRVQFNYLNPTRKPVC